MGIGMVFSIPLDRFISVLSVRIYSINGAEVNDMNFPTLIICLIPLVLCLSYCVWAYGVIKDLKGKKR